MKFYVAIEETTIKHTWAEVEADSEKEALKKFCNEQGTEGGEIIRLKEPVKVIVHPAKY